MINLALCILLGIIAGTLSGLIGIGGGVIIVIATFVCLGFLFGSLLGARLATPLATSASR